MAPTDVELDRSYMLRALRLADRGRPWTSPNPVVGAVLVKGGRIIGEGWHRRLGLAHAEQEALSRAGSSARGATLYVTLEPCAHTGRTPPCTEALIRAGIGRCVVALEDPNPIVSGRGIRMLRRSGVRTEVGLCAAEGRRTLAGYWLAYTQGRPLATWKVASTLDGRIADRAGGSRWVTGPVARQQVHRMRGLSDAVMIGARTARTDDPRLTVRLPRVRRQPLRVVCDTRLGLPLGLRLFGRALARGTVVVCGPDAPAGREAALRRRGVEVWRLPLARGGVSPRALARRLVRAGCHDVLVEGGARLGTSWLSAGLIDRLALFTAPRILGAEGLSWCGPLGISRLVGARTGRIVDVGRRGKDAFMLVELGG